MPVAYTPNNDLIISADQGGIEITNVHPGNNVYNELILSQNWSGTGKTLLFIVVAGTPRIIGINGFTVWPAQDSVSHADMVSNVIVYLPSDTSGTIVLTDKNEVSETYESVDGVITIPQSALSDSIERKVKLQLIAGETEYGYIITLPISEEEPMPYDNTGLLNNGSEAELTTMMASDFVDIQLVTDIVYSGIASSPSITNLIAMSAYDEDRNFVKVLIGKNTSTTPKHVTPDGTYRYIRACRAKAYDGYLSVYYRNRG